MSAHVTSRYKRAPPGVHAGDPESGSVQEILLYQNRTMRMMYSLIGEALKAKGATGAHPRDYLNFFCLGNREARSAPPPVVSLTPNCPFSWHQVFTGFCPWSQMACLQGRPYKRDA